MISKAKIELVTMGLYGKDQALTQVAAAIWANPLRKSSAQAAQFVHSYEQIRASALCAGRSISQIS